MTEQPLLTIIIPVYNVEKYVKKCLTSVINQTYKNLEIIVVDDGSTDNSGKICDEIASLDNRIQVIHKKNGGLSDARNKGLDIARGDYIGFVDSDDFIDNNMYEELLTACKKYNAEISICGRICEKENLKEHYTLFTTQEKIMSSEDAIKDLLLQIDCDSAAWDKLYSAKLFNKIRYPFGVLHEDLNITSRLFALANKIVHTGKPLYHYLIRNGSICNEAFSEKRMDLYIQAADCREFIRDKYPQMSDEANWFVMRNTVGMIRGAVNSKNCEKEIKNKLRKIIVYELGMCKKNPYLPAKMKLGLYKKYIQLMAL